MKDIQKKPVEMTQRQQTGRATANQPGPATQITPGMNRVELVNLLRIQWLTGG